MRDREAVLLFLARLEGTIQRMRDGLCALGERDPVTQDLAIGILEGLEKQAWMLRVQRA